MTFELTDDGTMDTVICCGDCGAELRYNYDSSQADEVDPNDEGDAYDAFVLWAIEQAEADHVCEPDDDETNGPQEDDLTTTDHISFYYHGNHKAFHLQETSTGTFRIDAHPRRHVPGEYATVERAIRAFMQAEQYWPNCWFSDHGNAHLMDLERA